MINEQQQFGKTGESVAVAYLKSHGYAILEMNFRTKLGEIDLIAKDGDTIVFAEVKARRRAYQNKRYHEKVKNDAEQKTVQSKKKTRTLR